MRTASWEKLIGGKETALREWQSRHADEIRYCIVFVNRELKLERGSNVAQVKRIVGAICVVRLSTLRGVQSEAFRFSRSEDLRLNLGIYIRTIWEFGSTHPLPFQTSQSMC